MTTKEYILDGCSKLFIDLGVKAVRMDDIATHLAVSKRTIYELFRDKREIVAETLDYIAAKHHIEAEYFFTAEPHNIIEDIVKMLKWWEGNAWSINRFAMDVSRFYPDIYDDFAARTTESRYDLMRGKLNEGAQQGYLLPKLDVELTLYVITSSITTLVFGEKSNLPTGWTRNDLFRFIVLYFFRGLATEKGIKIFDEYINNSK